MNEENINNELLNTEINTKHIFKLTNDFFKQEINLDAKILLAESENLFQPSFLNQYPNVFWIVILTKDENFDNLFKKINEAKCIFQHDVFIQVFIESLKISKVYQYVQKFEEVTDEGNFDVLAKFVKKLNFSLVDLKFSEVFEFLDVTEKIIFIKKVVQSENENLIKIVMLFSAQINREFLLEAFEVKNLKNLIIILSNFDTLDVTEELLKKVYKNKIFIKEIIEKIIDQENLKALKVLFKNSSYFAKSFGFKKWKETTKKCLERKCYKILFEIQKVEENFYENIYDDDENFSTYLETFHENIEEENFEEIKKFVKKFPDFKFCADENQICALDKSIEADKYEIYSFLLSEGFLTYNQDKLEDKISKLPQEIRRKIQENNLKFLKPNPQNFIYILCTKCEVFGLSDENYHTEIREMITKLSKNPKLRPLLERAAETELKNVIDFRTKSIHLVDPVSTKKITGKAYHRKSLNYIAADEGKFERYGTFIHEISHLILYLIYDNDCLPFCKGDTVRENLWNEIFKTTFQTYQKSSKTDSIIYFAFKSYTKPITKKLELAVRANHILARYMNDQTKINEIQSQFPEIFDFNENFVLPDLKIQNIYYLTKLNNDFEVLKMIQNSNLKSIQYERIFENSQEIEDEPENLIFANENVEPQILCSNVPNLTILKIICEIFQSSSNKLNLRSENIFVDSEKLEQNILKNELKNLVQNSKVKKIFVNVRKSLKIENLKFIETLQSEIYFICDKKLFESDKNLKLEKWNQNFVTHEWKEITENSKAKLSEKLLNFQGKEFKISNFLNLSEIKVSSEIFTILCSDDKIIVNSQEIQTLEDFMPRKIEMKLNKFESSYTKNEDQDYEVISLEAFTEKFGSVQILLLSDMAGSGKTTFLWKVHESLLVIFPQHFILFIALKDYIDELSRGVKSFNDFIIKILNLDPLEAEIFTQKFAKGEVKILFDAFDEISPKCKRETLKLFKLFKAQQKNQIWITTRTHLEYELEIELDVEAHRLKILDESEQVEFLKLIWKNSHDDEKLIQECAEDLVEKISQLIQTDQSVIGVPLIVRALGNYLKQFIKINFKAQIENLKISNVYEKIFDTSFNVLEEKFPEKCSSHLKASDSISKVYKYLAIEYIFDENSASELILDYDESYWTIEEISRGGIVKYGKHKTIQFNHETYAENLIAKVFYEILKNVKKPTYFQINFMVEILIVKEFRISRIFLDEMLENFEEKSLKILKSDEKFPFFFLSDLLSNLPECVNIFELIIELAKKQNFVGFDSLLTTSTDSIYDLIFLFEIFPSIKSEIKLSKLIDEILKLCGENFFRKFLFRVYGEKDTIFHRFASINASNIKLFYKKMNKKIISRKELKEILFKKNYFGQNFFNSFISRPKIKNGECQSVFYLIENYLSHDDQIRLIEAKHEDCENVLMSMVKNVDFVTCRAIYSFTKHILGDEKLKALFEENIYGFLYNLTYWVKSKEFFEFFWRQISGFFETKQFFVNFKENILELTLENNVNPEILLLVFCLTKENLASKKELKSLITRENSESDNLLGSVSHRSSISCLEILFQELYEIFDKNDMEKFLMTAKNGKFLKYFVGQASNFDLISFMLNIFEENLSKENFSNILTTYDNDGSILHSCIDSNLYKKSKELLKLIWMKIESLCIDNENLKTILKVKKNEENILHVSIRKNNLFFDIYENYFCKYLKFEYFIYECNENGENFLHLLAQDGSTEMLEFAFKKLKENLDQEDLKNFLKLKSTKSEKNILHFCAERKESKNETYEFILQELQKNLSQQEVSELFTEVYKKGKNVLHLAFESIYPDYDRKDCDKFNDLKKMFFHLKEVFCDNEIFKKVLKSKDSRGRNILLYSIDKFWNFECIFFYLFEEIFCEHFKCEDFIYECDDLGDNFLHLIVQLYSPNKIEFAFKKLVENLAVEELTNFVKTKNEQSQNNLLHTCLINATTSYSSPTENALFVFEKIIQFLDESESKIMLTEKNCNEKSPIVATLNLERPGAVEALIKIHTNHFGCCSSDSESSIIAKFINA